ncbi:PepSY domain-containing protein [Piscibacillus halophilus]|uniref:Peptidase propeptide and YPEB domain-containing protein n=3 Tax=Piscibacillus halophilus TaxID=571933 RepID=A0A1H9GYJ0_9BACI|nr:PepSY domain-containing protein [Piscibacillus halophilus]SEQ55186.1 Peptidase propeptide and YPEB domain-containing protein [Piscibacillus halophilus]
MKERIIWMLGGAIITVVVFVLAQQFLFGTTSAEQISQEEAEQIVLDTYSGDIEEVIEDVKHYSIKVKLPSGSYIVIVNKQSGELEEIRSHQTAQSDEKEQDSVGEEEKTEEDVEEPSNEDEQEESNSVPDKENNGDHEIVKEPEQEFLTKDEILKELQDEYEGEFQSIEFMDEERPYYGVEIEDKNEFIHLMIDAQTGEVTDEQIELKTQTPISQEEAIDIALDKQSGEIEDFEYKEINGTLYYIIEIETENDQDVTMRINALNGEVTVIWDDKDDDDDDQDQEED